MRKVMLVLLLLFLSACAQYPETESLKCQSNTDFLNFVDATQVDSYEAKQGWIMIHEHSSSLKINERVEKVIQNQYKGSRADFIEAAKQSQYQHLAKELPEITVDDQGDTITMTYKLIYSEKPEDWRGLMIPNNRNLAEIRSVFERQNICH